MARRPISMPIEPMDVLAAARSYLQRGWVPIPIPRGSKKPVLEAWPTLRLAEENLADSFQADGNIGLLTGEPSGGLVDVDLDCDEAVALAGAFLPATPMRSGRDARPGSHAWFTALGSQLKVSTYKDIDNKTVLLELRADGHQTVVPPSVHPDGDRYRWEGTLDPSEIVAEELQRAVRELAAATLLVRHWPKKHGSRHQIANALAGMLLRGGWDEVEVARFIEAAARAAGDEEAAGRAKNAVATARTLAAGGKATGAPTLATLIGKAVVDRVYEWLGLGRDTAFTASIAYSQEPAQWPERMDAAALHGPAGEFVRLIEPHTEADLVAILVQVLVAFGNCVGRGPHFPVEADEHHPNLFAGIVGATSKGRKGTSWGQVRRLFFPVDEAWVKGSIASGLSSGEGLIWAVRDEILRHEPIKQRGVVSGYQDVVADPGISDKRLLVVESELASALRVLGREGNTLSATVRSAWDTGDLRTMVKNSPARATGAHISILGHITRDELIRYLDTTEAGNGFANRFIWVCVRRSKCLPEGGCFEQLDLRRIRDCVASAIRAARTVTRIQRDPAAKELWRSVYEDLSAGKPGLFGAVISRAEAQVTRLSAIYALLDGSPVIQVQHLEAALAVWDYAEASAGYIFGDSLGDPVADTILKALRSTPEGLTRDDIRNLFGRNQPAPRIVRASNSLLEQGLARREREEDTGGRPAERWFATRPYAVNAINAERGAGEEGYRVYRVNGVAQPDGTPSTSGPDEPAGDDEAVL